MRQREIKRFFNKRKKGELIYIESKISKTPYLFIFDKIINGDSIQAQFSYSFKDNVIYNKEHPFCYMSDLKEAKLASEKEHILFNNIQCEISK